MRVLLALALASVCMPAMAASEGCAATPEAAAKAALGTASNVQSSGAGFRAEEVQVDPVLRRAWVRVRRCDAPQLPVVLVPFSAPVKGVGAVVSVPSTPAMHTEVRQSLIRVGDPVRAVFVSASTHMELQAQAMQQGSEGQVISLRVKRPVGVSADEPEQRIHGMVRADGMVEVIP